MQCTRLIAITLLTCALIVAACTRQAPGEPTPRRPVIVVIGKSVDPYWSNIEAGVRAAGIEHGVETVFFVPPKEDVAAQIQTLETYIAQRVTGIAIAPSDPQALEPFIRKATEAGILVSTLDTPAVEGSASLVYIGTDNVSAGVIAGNVMLDLLPQGGLVGTGRGSDTALNALQRTQGFLSVVEGSRIRALPPYNDQEDPSTALELASATISAHPDLAGAFAMYGATGPAWITAIEEANAADDIVLICFDATTDIIRGIEKGVVHATIAQREYDMGYKSVQIIKLMADKGVRAALAEMGARDGVISTGVDVVTAGNLKAYETALDARGIPHQWSVASGQ